MPFEIIHNDITTMHVDAIVNSTSPLPKIEGGTDLIIHKVAGSELLKARERFGILNDTEAVITKGYNLPATYVIHVIAPVYIDGFFDEHAMLYNTYMNALKLAQSRELTSIAFPLIASGTYAFPRGEALTIALRAIEAFLKTYEMMIYLVVYDDASYQLSKARFNTIKSYIKHHQDQKETLTVHQSKAVSDLDEWLQIKDETFTESLLSIIDAKGLDDVSVYKKANIDRKLFSKIRSNPAYQVSKPTAIALALALELNLDETQDLLMRAGYALSPSQPFDLIVQFFIESGNYNLFEINQTLFAFEGRTLGGSG